MATSEPKPVVPPRPRAELSNTKLPITVTPTTWFRLTAASYASPIYWSRSGRYRFDSPAAKWGVCYAGESIPASFQEVFGDKIRRSKRLEHSEIEPLAVWQINVSSGLRAVELRGETLAVIDATLQCFVGSYPLSQAWGRAFMDHPDDIDGLEYFGRRSGQTCLALFGDEKTPRPHQAAISPKNLGMLTNWRGLWNFFDRIQLQIDGLPATKPPALWG